MPSESEIMRLIDQRVELTGTQVYVLQTGGRFDVNGIADALVIDADGDTSISAPTDDQIDIELNSVDHVVLKAVATADAAATTNIQEIIFTSPVDTTGTNTHNALNIDIEVGNATGGTNTVRGIMIDGVTADAQVTEEAIRVGSGWPVGLALDDAQDILLGAGDDWGLRWSTADADNHAQVIFCDNTNQALHLTDKAAVATDWNIAAISNPTLIVHSDTTPTTDYIGFGYHDGTNAAVNIVGATGFELRIDSVGALRWDDAAISGFAAATDTAGKDVYVETQDAGATPTTAKAGGAGGSLSIVASAGGATNSQGAHAAGAGGDVAITAGAGGNATAGSGNGGAGGTITLTPGAGGTTSAGTAGRPGVIIERGVKLVNQGAPSAKTTNATLTAAEVLAGIITVNQGATGTSAQQLPAAADLDTALPDAAAGDAFDLYVINISTVAGEDASLTTNTGWTLVGSMDVESDDADRARSSGHFRLRKTGAGAWTCYRIA